MQKFEYLEKEKSFLDEIKRIFRSFWRDHFVRKKNWQKIAHTSFKLVDSNRAGEYFYSLCLMQSSQLILEPFAKTTNLENSRQQSTVASSLPLRLVVGKVLVLWLRFKLYLEITFPFIFTNIVFPKAKKMSTLAPSSAMTPVAVFLNEISYRMFPISSLSLKILEPLTYSKISVG